jgi:hypothetical protein
MLHGGGAHLLEEAQILPCFGHLKRKRGSLEMGSVARGG